MENIKNLRAVYYGSGIPGNFDVCGYVGFGRLFGVLFFVTVKVRKECLTVCLL